MLQAEEVTELQRALRHLQRICTDAAAAAADALGIQPQEATENAAATLGSLVDALADQLKVPASSPLLLCVFASRIR